jgi:hypothetical protein
MSSPQDRNKILKRVAAFGKRVGTRGTIASGCQVPAVDVQPGRRSRWNEFAYSRKWAERRAATQVAIRIHYLRLPKVRVMTGGPFAAEIRAIMTAIAIGLSVHNVAAYSYQGRVQPSRIELDGCDIRSDTVSSFEQQASRRRRLTPRLRQTLWVRTVD